MDTVFLTVSVTGKGNNAVPGIARDRFQVIEDGIGQEITYFLEDSRPITVGFIFDDSFRMEAGDKYYVLEEAAQSFLGKKDPRDEFFVVKMADTPVVAVNFTTDVNKLPVVYGASGWTRLYDAIYVGLSVMKEAANPRKMLVVITAGGDGCAPSPGDCNPSNKTTNAEMLENFALKQPVQIYTLFLPGPASDMDVEGVNGDAILLDLLGTMTGGRLYAAQNSARAVEALTAEIARGVKTQYLVGYKSTSPARDGKRRGVKVKVSSPEGSPKLDVLTKAGYYTQKDS
jgi:VWFA-related protein